LVENRYFHTQLQSTPPLGVPVGIRFGLEKVEWHGYPKVKNVFRICLLVSTQCTNVTDTRRTDRRRTTTADAALMQASRGKKDRSKLRSLARSDRLLERLQLRLSTRYLKRY